MKEQNHQATKLNSAKVENESHHKVDMSPTATGKYLFIVFIALLLTFFIGAIIYWKYS